MRIITEIHLTVGWLTQNPACGHHTREHDEKLSHESSFNTCPVRDSAIADALQGWAQVYPRRFNAGLMQVCIHVNLRCIRRPHKRQFNAQSFGSRNETSG